MSSSSSSGGAASARDGCRSSGARDVFSMPSINIALLRSEIDSTCVETLVRQFAVLWPQFSIFLYMRIHATENCCNSNLLLRRPVLSLMPQHFRQSVQNVNMSYHEMPGRVHYRIDDGDGRSEQT